MVVCGVPFGPGNSVNLQIARSALARGKKVLIMAGVENRDFTPNREATDAVHGLIKDGAGVWSDMADLLTSLPRSIAERTQT